MDARTEPIERVADACARTIVEGGSIAFPVDTGYAIGCDPFRAATLERIRAGEPLTFFVATPSEFLEYARSSPSAALAARRLLPGPVTLIVRRPPSLPDFFEPGAAAIAFRVPESTVARTILERTGPLAAVEVRDATSASPDLTIENGPPRYESETSIVDLSHTPARLVLEGVVPYDRIAELLGSLEPRKARVR